MSPADRTTMGDASLLPRRIVKETQRLLSEPGALSALSLAAAWPRLASTRAVPRRAAPCVAGPLLSAAVTPPPAPPSPA